MKPQCGVLVGVCRPVPDGATFVVPVFRTDDGKHVTQRVAGGWIQSLEEVTFAEEFVPLNSAVRVTVGDPAICGIEVNEFICVGCAPSLSKINKISPAPVLSVFQRSTGQTFDAVAVEGSSRPPLLDRFNAILGDRTRTASTSDLFTTAVSDFMQALIGGEKPLKYKRAFSFNVKATAASLLLGLVLIFGLRGYLEAQRVVTTNSGEVRQKTLSDGSVVYVDARSRIEVEYTDTERIVHLYTGGALFEVKKDLKRPFIARTHLIDAIAVGTKFEVSIAPGVTTTVSEGIVEVKSHSQANGRTVRLHAGEELHVPDNSQTLPRPEHVDANRRLDWESGWLRLSGLTIAEGAEQLNRRNKVQLVVEGPTLGSTIVRSANVKIDSPEAYAKIVVGVSRIKMTIDKNKDVIRLSE